jgi:hypothetical protein
VPILFEFATIFMMTSRQFHPAGPSMTYMERGPWSGEIGLYLSCAVAGEVTEGNGLKVFTAKCRRIDFRQIRNYADANYTLE